MPWGRLDDSLYDHPKLDRLRHRLAAVGLHALALSWCNRWLTDGHVSRRQVAKLGGTARLADDLVGAGLWERDGQDYRIHDFLEFNQSREEVEGTRRTKAEAGRMGGLASGRARKQAQQQVPQRVLRSSAKQEPSTSNGTDEADASRLVRTKTNTRPDPYPSDSEVIYNPRTGEATDALGQPLDRGVRR